MNVNDIQDYGFKPDDKELTQFFDVEEKVTKGGSMEKFFNLNDGVVIDGIDEISDANFIKYICKNGDNLRFISFRKYGTIHYWWLIAKINKIYDMFEPLEAGRELRLLPRERMNFILNIINGKVSSNA